MMSIKHITYTLVGLSILMSSCSKESTPGGGSTPTVEAPGKAILLSPENNKTCEEVNSLGQLSFSWKAATDTDKYDLKITNLNTQAVTNYNNLTATVKDVSLVEGIPYSWNITSKNSGSTTATSDTWQFYLAGEGVINYAPFPATAESPSPGATVSPSNGIVNVSWEGSDADGDSLTYTLEVDTVDGVQGNVIAEGITESSAAVEVEVDKVYYWRVITSDGANSSTSIVYTFRTSS